MAHTRIEETLINALSIVPKRAQLKLEFKATTGLVVVTTNSSKETYVIQRALKGLGITISNYKNESFTMPCQELNLEKFSMAYKIAEKETLYGNIMAFDPDLDFFKGRDCAYVYFGGQWSPSIYCALGFRSYTAIPVLLENNANPNEAFHGTTPLQLLARQAEDEYMDDTSGYEVSLKLTADILIGRGAEVNLASPYGITPFQEAVLAGHLLFADYLKQNGAITTYSSKLTLKEFATLYHQLRKIIDKEHTKSQQAGKLFLLLIGEAHDNYIIKLIIAMLLSDLSPLIGAYCIEQPVQEGISFFHNKNIYNQLDREAATHHKIEICAIDTGRSGKGDDTTSIGVARRDIEMTKNLLELKKPCIATVGSMHLMGIAEDKELQDRYHIFPLGLASALRVGPCPSPEFQERIAYQAKQGDKISFLAGASTLFESEEIINFLSGVENFAELHKKLSDQGVVGDKVITPRPFVKDEKGPSGPDRITQQVKKIEAKTNTGSLKVAKGFDSAIELEAFCKIVKTYNTSSTWINYTCFKHVDGFRSKTIKALRAMVNNVKIISLDDEKTLTSDRQARDLVTMTTPVICKEKGEYYILYFDPSTPPGKKTILKNSLDEADVVNFFQELPPGKIGVTNCLGSGFSEALFKKFKELKIPRPLTSAQILKAIDAESLFSTDLYRRKNLFFGRKVSFFGIEIYKQNTTDTDRIIKEIKDNLKPIVL